MPPEKRKRENSHLPAEGWSEWYRAMVPKDNVPDDWERYYVQRNERNPGYYCISITERLPPSCGIYEFQLRKQDVSRNVVYVGSTCRASTCESLTERVLEYCKDGSHKKALINKALRRGYEIYVRVMESKDKESAEEEENDLLDEYDYAWNKRRNGSIRDVL